MHSIIKKELVREFDPDAPRSTPAPSTRSSGKAAQVELVRLDGHVRAIQLTCACGQVHVIDLEYAEDIERKA